MNEELKEIYTWEKASEMLDIGNFMKLPEWEDVCLYRDTNGDVRGLSMINSKDLNKTFNMENYHERDDWEWVGAYGFFGDALSELRKGKKVRRDCWHEDLFIFLVPGSTFKISGEKPLDRFYTVGEEVNYHPHINMRLPDGSVCMWNPNQLDILGSDWICFNN